MCAERRRLLAEYHLAIDRYVEALRELRERTPKTSQAEYQRLLAESESRRKQSEAACQALVAHMQSHGCIR